MNIFEHDFVLYGSQNTNFNKMARKEEFRLPLHKPSTIEVFLSLKSMPSYSKILFLNSGDKPYKGFLEWLLSNNFLENDYERLTIKFIAEAYKTKASKITNWIKNIYEDIFILNAERPDLFYTGGIKIYMNAKHYDNRCAFQMSLMVVPREFETMVFYFFNAKVGTGRFWVKNINHEIENDIITVYLILDGGILNKYREFVLEKALFQGKIGLMTAMDVYPFEVERILNELYRG